MAWNPLEALKRTFGGEAPAAPPAAPAAKAAPKPEAEASVTTGLKDLEKQGLLGKFFRHWKSPAMLAQIRAITARMQADGVNMRDRKAVTTWIEAHKEEIEAGKIEAPKTGKVETFVKTGPDAGRNDPCPCGSGRKFKKCCAAKP